MFDGIESNWDGSEPERRPRRPRVPYSADEYIGAAFTLAGVVLCAVLVNEEFELLKLTVHAVGEQYGWMGALRVGGFGTALVTQGLVLAVNLAGYEKDRHFQSGPAPS